MSKDQASQEAKEMMTIQEGVDGGAVVDLPDSIPSPHVQAGEESDASDEAAERREIAETGSVDPEMDEMRAAKRNKRRAKKEATSTGNGDLLANAQEMWFEARRSHEALENLKSRAVQPQRPNTIQAPDPMLQRHASEWMMNNSWYDPNGKDPDSRRALNEDQILADEGYDPRTAEYWEELDNRLQKYIPHRYTVDNDERPSQRTRPKSVVTSSGRESSPSNSGGRNAFHLSPERVRAMKDGGYWEDPEKRAKMIRSYALADKQSESNRR